MSDFQNPQNQQGILDSTTVGGNLSARDFNQESNTVNSNNTFITLILSGNKSVSTDEEALISALSPILTQIKPETIQQAYQNSLPPDAELWDLESHDIAAILKKLDEFRRLADFVEQLTQDANISEELREKIKHYTKKLPPKKPQENKLDKPPNNCRQELKSFILFTLKPDNNDNKDRFLLNSWLIIDDSKRNVLEKYIPLINANEVQAGRYCSFREICYVVDELLQKGLDYLLKRSYVSDEDINLVIEFFLPRALMLTEVDRWLINDGLGKIIFGTKYPIRLRSLERLEKGYLRNYFNSWKKNWNNVQTRLNDQSVFMDFEHIQEMKDFNGESLKVKLKKKIGLKVTCPPPQSKLEELFIAILRAATPIAIWTRRDLADCGCLTAIDDFLSCKLLSNLCESVKILREEANTDPEDHFGSHLALLWEDPYRLTPDVMVELMPPEL